MKYGVKDKDQIHILPIHLIQYISKIYHSYFRIKKWGKKNVCRSVWFTQQNTSLTQHNIQNSKFGFRIQQEETHVHVKCMAMQA